MYIYIYIYVYIYIYNIYTAETALKYYTINHTKSYQLRKDVLITKKS